MVTGNKIFKTKSAARKYYGEDDIISKNGGYTYGKKRHKARTKSIWNF